MKEAPEDARLDGRAPADESSARPARAGPGSVRLDPEVLAGIPALLRAHRLSDPPRISGATVLVASHGKVVFEAADGWAVRWANPQQLLPREQWIPARADTIYDVASLTKLFTATAVLQLVEQGALSLEDPVARHLPRFAVTAAHDRGPAAPPAAESGPAGKTDVLVWHLLSHVSGLPATIELWTGYADRKARLDAVLTSPLLAPPGTAYLYSDLGMITAGALVEKVSERSLDAFIHERITGPLGMHDTFFLPAECAATVPDPDPRAAAVDPALRGRIAATEFMTAEQRGRTGPALMVRGQVHDENAWVLGGVAGHAGLFSTAGDLLRFAHVFLDGGSGIGATILQPETVRDLVTDRISAITGADGARRGLGPELAAAHYHGGLASERSIGHTGFTGTSMVIDPVTETVVILLASAVHPTREWAATNELRRAVANCVAQALVR